MNPSLAWAGVGLFALQGLTTVAGCRSPAVARADETGGDIIDVESSQPEGVRSSASPAIELQRSGLPHGYHYTVTLRADGRVEWVGERNVAMLGEASGVVRPQQVRDLMERLTALDVFSPEFANKHRNRKGSCHDADATFRVSFRGTAGDVTFVDDGCWKDPEIIELREAAEMIDEVANDAKWKYQEPIDAREP
jgi:hypothetical protein